MAEDWEKHHHHHQHHSDHGPIEYRYCPCCGGELERRQVKAAEPQRLVCRRCAFIFYQDPKVVAGTVFTLDGGVVLLRRGIEPALNRWVFPGGYVDRGESVAEAAIREAREEARVEVKLSSLLNVYSYPGSVNVVVVYAAAIVGGTPSPGDESVEARAFAASQIPWDELAFPSTRDALKDYVRLYLEPSNR